MYVEYYQNDKTAEEAAAVLGVERSTVNDAAGQSRILCKVQNVVQIEHNLCKTVAAQAAAALFIK